MRLTIKVENEYFSNVVPNEHHNAIKPCLNKLGQLEDIEDELGIDLITLFKIFSCEEIIHKTGELLIYHRSEYLSVDFKNKCIIDDNFNNLFFYFRDYGKTWALTKEELE